jgi:hypothetical protein
LDSLDFTRRALDPHFLQRVALIAFLALHFMQIFLFNNLSSASGKRAIFFTCYYFLLTIRYIARLMDVKGYNAFHQKSAAHRVRELFSLFLINMQFFFLQTQSLFNSCVASSCPANLKELKT